MMNRRGLSLIELIITVALLGIIAVAIIPGFATYLHIMNKGKDLTTDSFDTQSQIEGSVFEIRQKIQKSEPLTSVSNLTTVTRSIFSKSVELQRFEVKFLDNTTKVATVYLSETLAMNEDQARLSANELKIKINGADGTVAPLSATLTAECTPLVDPSFYTYIYKWYVSYEGISTPRWPDDFVLIDLPGIDPPLLDGLAGRNVMNRFVTASVTPVDSLGLRGEETISSNRVYVSGPEWRTETEAWIDKDNNGAKSSGDVGVPYGPLLHILDNASGFDTANKFSIDDTGELDPSGGTLFVPMRVTTPVEEDLQVEDDKSIDWYTHQSIQLAKGIHMINGKNIEMVTRQGGITLYQYVELDALGNLVVDSGTGLSKTIEDGPTLQTTGDILLKTEGRGVIGLNAFTEIIGKNITIAALDPFYMTGAISANPLKKTRILATGNISIDTSKNVGITGNRDIYINKAELEVDGSGGSIELKTRDKISMDTAVIKGTASSVLKLNAEDGIELKETTLVDINTDINSTTTIVGGGWSGGTLTVPDGKILTFKKGAAPVSVGALNVGNTGRLTFDKDIRTDIALVGTPQLLLEPIAMTNEVAINSNYGRNTAYGHDEANMTVSVPGSYRNVGSGDANLEFTADKIAGTGSITELKYSYVGGKLTISGIASGPCNETVALTVRDKFSGDQIESTTLFTFSRTEPNQGPATIVVTGTPAPTSYTVVFRDYNGTVLSTQTVNHGYSAVPPTAPSRPNFTFTGWNGDYTRIVANSIFTAQYVERVTVTFKMNYGPNATYTTLQTVMAQPLGSLPAKPLRADGYGFRNWNTVANGSGNTFTATTAVTANITVYAQWGLKFSSIPTSTVNYITVNGVNYQKISSNRLLRRDGVEECDWYDAVYLSAHYYENLGKVWITGSGILSRTEAESLNKTNVRDNDEYWWTGTERSTNTAYYINRKGDTDWEDKDYYDDPYLMYRPYVTVETANEPVVQSGGGTTSNPYVLWVE